MLEELIELTRAVTSGRTRSQSVMAATLRVRAVAARLRQPVAELARALHVHPAADPWLSFRSYAKWPVDLSRAFRHLPEELVKPAALEAPAAFWLFHLLLERRPSAVLEIGSGISTFLTAVALERLADPLGRARQLTIETDLERQSTISRALARAGLLASIELCPALSDAHDLSGVDFAFVSHGHASLGGTAVVPKLQFGASIVVENASSPDAEAAIAEWQRMGWTRLVTFTAHAPGLALLERVQA